MTNEFWSPDIATLLLIPGFDKPLFHCDAILVALFFNHDNIIHENLNACFFHKSELIFEELVCFLSLALNHLTQFAKNHEGNTAFLIVRVPKRIEGCDPAKDGFHEILGIAPVLRADEDGETTCDCFVPPFLPNLTFLYSSQLPLQPH